MTLTRRDGAIRHILTQNTINEVDVQVAQGSLKGHCISAVGTRGHADNENVPKLHRVSDVVAMRAFLASEILMLTPSVLL